MRSNRSVRDPHLHGIIFPFRRSKAGLERLAGGRRITAPAAKSEARRIVNRRIPKQLRTRIRGQWIAVEPFSREHLVRARGKLREAKFSIRSCVRDSRLIPMGSAIPHLAPVKVHLHPVRAPGTGDSVTCPTMRVAGTSSIVTSCCSGPIETPCIRSLSKRNPVLRAVRKFGRLFAGWLQFLGFVEPCRSKRPNLDPRDLPAGRRNHKFKPPAIVRHGRKAIVREESRNACPNRVAVLLRSPPCHEHIGLVSPPPVLPCANAGAKLPQKTRAPPRASAGSDRTHGAHPRTGPSPSKQKAMIGFVPRQIMPCFGRVNSST